MKKKVKRALYVGSFDPPTLGHDWIIRESLKVFDEVVVAISVNKQKNSLFSSSERVAMLQKTVLKGVRVVFFDSEYSARFARKVGATILVRGIRNEADFVYEQTLRHINEKINPNVHTVFLMPPPELGGVSSSVVKGMIGPKGWEKLVAQYVSPEVLNELQNKFPPKRKRP